MPRQYDRVRETSTTTGTGTLTTSGTAATACQTLASRYSVGDVVPLYIVQQAANEWEMVNAVMLTATTFARQAGDVVNGSSGQGVLVNFSAGTKDVFVAGSANDSLVARRNFTLHRFGGNAMNN